MTLFSAVRRTLAVVALGLLLLAGTGCGHQESIELSDILARYIGAVESRNFPDLWKMRSWRGPKESPTPLPEFETEATNYYRDYEIGKRSGEIHFDPWGIAAIRSLALGKGTFYQIVNIESPSPTTRRVEIRVFTPYENLDYTFFPKDTTLYFMAKPLGKIHKHVVGDPETDNILRGILLKEITLIFSLSQPESGKGWEVLTLTPDPQKVLFGEMVIAIEGHS